MSDFRLTTAVALICFNRPAETSRAMEILRRVQPPRLYVIADAPRAHVEGEAERCAQVRAIASAASWPCEVIKDFADRNLGCRDRVISGLNHAFERDESLIVLEDDCLAHEDFFRFCQEMLARYRKDGKIFAISGDNFQPDYFSIPDSYYFSRIFHCWGWATWRDRWQAVDFSMAAWPKLREGDWLAKALGSQAAASYYRNAFDQTYHGQNSSWAYRASFACLTGGLLNIHPRVNMVTNIGVGGDATHTKSDTGMADRQAHGLAFPLAHPGVLRINEAADRHTFNLMGGSRRHKMRMRLEHLMRNLLPARVR
jgi:hypothetical protein